MQLAGFSFPDLTLRCCNIHVSYKNIFLTVSRVIWARGEVSKAGSDLHLSGLLGSGVVFYGRGAQWRE